MGKGLIALLLSGYIETDLYLSEHFSKVYRIDRKKGFELDNLSIVRGDDLTKYEEVLDLTKDMKIFKNINQQYLSLKEKEFQ